MDRRKSGLFFLIESGLFSLFSSKLVPSQFSDFSLLFIYFSSADRASLHAVAFFRPKTADPAVRYEFWRENGGPAAQLVTTTLGRAAAYNCLPIVT